MRYLQAVKCRNDFVPIKDSKFHNKLKGVFKHSFKMLYKS